MTKTYEGKRKAECRKIIFNQLRPAKSFAGLTGSELICVREMIDRGIIGARTRNFWIENNRRKLPAMNKNKQLFDLFDIEPTIVPIEISQWKPKYKIDLLNLDLEESFSPAIGKWLNHTMDGKLADQSQVVVTFVYPSRQDRTNDFIAWADKFFNNDPVLKNTRDQHVANHTNHHDVRSTTMFILLSCALHHFNVRCKSIIRYKEKNSSNKGSEMVAFLLDLNRIPEAILPSYEALFDRFDKQYVPDPDQTGWAQSANDPDQTGNRIGRPKLRMAADLLLEDLLPIRYSLEESEDDIVLRSPSGLEVARDQTIDGIRLLVLG